MIYRIYKTLDCEFVKEFQSKEELYSYITGTAGSKFFVNPLSESSERYWFFDNVAYNWNDVKIEHYEYNGKQYTNYCPRYLTLYRDDNSFEYENVWSIFDPILHREEIENCVAQNSYYFGKRWRYFNNYERYDGNEYKHKLQSWHGYNYLFRYDPVPGTGYGRWYGRYYRRLRSGSERRGYTMTIEESIDSGIPIVQLVRGRRRGRNIPDSWNLERYRHREKGWKTQSKKKRQHGYDQKKIREHFKCSYVNEMVSETELEL